MAGLDDYQFYSRFQSQESPFWESPRRRRPDGVDEFDPRNAPDVRGEHFHLYDVPPLEEGDLPEEERTSGPFSNLFLGSSAEMDVKSGKDAWQALFGPSKRDLAADRDTEAAITWATRNHSWWLNCVSLTTEYVIAHPLLVIRRQCQLNVDSRSFHLYPWSTIGVVYRLAKSQGLVAFYKGFTSVLLVKGITMWSEDFFNRVTPWSSTFPRQVSIVETCGHLAVKCGGLVVAAPFQAASLVETVQSDIASDSPGFLDVLREGCYRLTCWSLPQSGRLLPIWAVVPCAVVEGVARHFSTEVLYKLFSWGYKTFNPDRLRPSCLSSLLSSSSKSPKKSPRQSKRRSKEEKAEKVDDRCLTEAEKISWATKEAYNEAVFRVWASFGAHLLTYPLETVLNRLLLQGTRTIIDDLDSNGTSVVAVLGGYSGFRDCVRTIAVQEGWRGFYKGAGTLFWLYLAHFAALRLADVVLVRYLGSTAEEQHRLTSTLSSTVNLQVESVPEVPEVLPVVERRQPDAVVVADEWRRPQQF